MYIYIFFFFGKNWQVLVAGNWKEIHWRSVYQNFVGWLEEYKNIENGFIFTKWEILE